MPSTNKQGESSFDDYINFRFRLPCVSDLSDDDKIILHSVDQLELHLWALEQRNLGNKFAEEIIENQTNSFENGSLDSISMEFYLRIAHTGVVPDRVGLTAKFRTEFTK